MILCLWQSKTVAYDSQGVQLVAASSVLAALLVSAAISVVVWKHAPRALLRRFAPRDPRGDEAWVREYTNLLADLEGLRRLRLGIVELGEPIAMAVGGREPRVLVSVGLLDLLDRSEAETVIAHEMMHLKHRDAEFKVLSRVLSRVLFFDPFSKFFDPAVHREREYLADETSGRLTAKPAALASALLKLSDRGQPPKAVWGLSIHGPQGRIFSRYPPLQERVRRLLLLDRLLSTRDPET